MNNTIQQQSAATMVHPFESSNLGKAPFRFITVEKFSTSCAYCGTGIIWRFLCKGSAPLDRVFGVGCDCIEKVDYGMYCAAKKAKRDAIRADRLNTVAKARKTQREKNLREFEIVEPEIYAYLVEAIRISDKWYEMSIEERASFANRNDIPFCCSLHSQIGRFGKLSDKQLETIRKIMVPKPVDISNHVGEVGEKITFEATLKFRRAYESQFGTYHIVSMSDEHGNEIVYKGSTIEFLSIETRDEYGNIDRQGFLDQGEKVKLTAKVKEHALYQGKKQTVIGYVKKASEVKQNKKKK